MDRRSISFNVIYMFSISSGWKIMSFGDRLSIHQAVQICSNLSFHRSHSICNHDRWANDLQNLWFFIYNSLRVYRSLWSMWIIRLDDPHIENSVANISLYELKLISLILIYYMCVCVCINVNCVFIRCRYPSGWSHHQKACMYWTTLFLSTCGMCSENTPKGGE